MYSVHLFSEEFTLTWPRCIYMSKLAAHYTPRWKNSETLSQWPVIKWTSNVHIMQYNIK